MRWGITFHGFIRKRLHEANLEAVLIAGLSKVTSILCHLWQAKFPGEPSGSPSRVVNHLPANRRQHGLDEADIVFVDGQLKRFQTLKEIRGIVAEARAKALA